MRSMVRLAMAVAVSALVVAGCDVGFGSADGPTVPEWMRPTGELFVVGPPDEKAQDQAVEMDGLAFFVPDGWEQVRAENDLNIQIGITPPDSTGAGVLITITKDPGDPDMVETLASVASAQLVLDGATDIAQRPASWEGWAYASAVTGTVNPADDDPRDYVLIVAQSDDRLVVGVSAQTEGDLDGSEELRVLRSVRAVE